MEIVNNELKDINARLRGRRKYTSKVLEQIKDVNDDKSNNVHMRVLASELKRILTDFRDQDSEIIVRIEAVIILNDNQPHYLTQDR